MQDERLPPADRVSTADDGRPPERVVAALPEARTRPERPAPGRARLRVLDEHPHNLPAQLSSFVGREREIAEVTRLLANARLVTLIGAPGVGKTRLALRVVADLPDQFADGVWLVELAQLTDPALVPQAVAAMLGVREDPGRPLTATLAGALRSEQMLLVLDNCEHLVVVCAAFVETLLRACPRLHVLATSREPLGIVGEIDWLVPALTVPDPWPLPLERLGECEAVRLFVKRARAIRSDFAATERNASGLVEICRRLDGIPLALELAAARVNGLTLAQIAARLGDRLELLTHGSRTAPPRQQSLRATVDWSYDLLSEPERLLLGRLSVFAGGWTLEAAEVVCGGHGSAFNGILDALLRLVEKSLVLVDASTEWLCNGGDEGARYRLLETIRQYALEKLRASGEEAMLRDRHLAWFLALAERAEPELGGPSSVAWQDRLELELDNLRAALAWSKILLEPRGTPDDVSRARPLSSPDVPVESEAGLRLAAALWRFWELRGHLGEGRARLTELLALASGRTAARAKALSSAGYLAALQGDYAATRAFKEEAMMLGREVGYTLSARLPRWSLAGFPIARSRLS